MALGAIPLSSTYLRIVASRSRTTIPRGEDRLAHIGLGLEPAHSRVALILSDLRRRLEREFGKSGRTAQRVDRGDPAVDDGEGEHRDRDARLGGDEAGTPSRKHP